jgi:hypothetical protein
MQQALRQKAEIAAEESSEEALEPDQSLDPKAEMAEALDPEQDQ